jgi:membrane associated rhomboid family serine protease
MKTRDLSPLGMHECERCSKQFDPVQESINYCPECVAAIRDELRLGSQVRRVWGRWRTPLSNLPWATFALLGVNFAVFGAEETLARHPWRYSWVPLLPLSGQDVFNGQLWRLLTHAFVHENSFHLLSNAASVILLGWIAEPIFGRVRFLVICALSTVVGGISYLFVLYPTSIAFGASVMVCGLMGALLTVYASNRTPLPKGARKWSLLLLLLALIALWIVPAWISLHKIHAGHAGGLLAGLILGLVMPTKTTRQSTSQVLAVASGSVLVSLMLFAAAHHRQEPALALERISDKIGPLGMGFSSTAWTYAPELERIVNRRPDLICGHLLLAEAYASAHRNDDSVREYKVYLDRRPYYAPAWAALGRLYMDSHRYGDAVDAFARNLAIVSQDPPQPMNENYVAKVWSARRDIAEAYAGAGRLDEAAAIYSKILQNDPQDYMAEKELRRIKELQAARDIGTSRTSSLTNNSN